MVGEAEYFNNTTLHPVGLSAVIILGLLLQVLPRRDAIWPFLILACFIPQAQRIVLMGADFDLMRVLIVFAWIRLVLRREWVGFIWARLDILFLCWMISGTIIYVLQYGRIDALVNRLGWMFDGLGTYFFLRCTLRDWIDLERIGFGLAVISIPVALAFLLEWASGHNAFAVFGGVPAITRVREGRLRCQGAFSHPILAGCFWATVLPLIFPLWSGRRYVLTIAGCISAFIIVVLSASSTPILSVLLVFVGLALYPARAYVRYIKWSFVALLILLHMIMNAPVWHLLSRISAVGGSTGYHRYAIIDATVNNFSKWALLGETDPMSWGVWQMRDITNQYVLEALKGGLLTLVFFISLLGGGFAVVGRLVKARELSHVRFFAWCVGVMLFAHSGAFIGVSYFGQITMLIYLTLAMIGSMCILGRPGVADADIEPPTFRLEED